MTPATIEFDIHMVPQAKGRKTLRAGLAPTCPAGRIPRVARLMALAIHFEELLRQGVVADYADLAEVGQVSRARVTQIMNLTLLAPDIQEELLHLPLVIAGRESLKLADLQPVARLVDWERQRRMWAKRRTANAAG